MNDNFQNRKIDIHTHILPKEIPNWMQKFGYGGFIRLEHHKPCCAKMVKDDGTVFREVQHNCWDPEIRISEFEQASVTQQVLSTVPIMFNYWAQADHALDSSRFLNDHLLEVVQKHPHRFYCLGTLPMQSAKHSVPELERLKKLGFQGVQIGTHVNGKNLDDPEIFEILQGCANLNLCVFVHPWDMMGGDRLKKYWLPWLVGMPTEVTTAICSMIFGGVFERLPSLRVAFAHGGGSYPGTFGRIEHGFAARPDLCAINNPFPPSRYLKKMYFDTLVHEPLQLKMLLELVGANQLALGTDYPFPLGEAQAGSMIESMKLNPEIKNRLYSGTALEWLGVQ